MTRRIQRLTSTTPAPTTGAIYIDGQGALRVYNGTGWTVLGGGSSAAGATGRAVLDFGTFPGSPDASVAVTGQSSIQSGSIARAWLAAEATAEHTADEHEVVAIALTCTAPTAGVGFTINGYFEPVGLATRTYGRWTVSWEWS